MRILHLVNHCNHANGNAHVAVDLACVQADRGHDVMLASAGGDYNGLLEAHRVASPRLVQNRKNPLTLIKSVLQLFALMRTFKPDVVHAHMMAGAAMGYVATRIFRTPLVTTVHNSFDRHSVLMRLGDKVVAVSEAERQSLLEKGYKQDQVAVVINGPNASPREGFLNLGREHNPDDLHLPSVITVCGLHHRKGVHDLLRAFKDTAAIQPQWTLHIIGDGPDKAKLQALTQELGLQERVEFLGPIGTPRAFLEKSDIFVLASYADPCSLAVAEARESGCAIIATAVGGTPELLQHGEAGKLVPPGSPADITRELLNLMSSPAELQDWKSRSRNGSEYFRVDRVVTDYDKIYRSLIS